MTEEERQAGLEALRASKKHWEEDNLPLTSIQVAKGASRIEARDCACCKLVANSRNHIDCSLCPMPDCDSSVWIDRVEGE